MRWRTARPARPPPAMADAALGAPGPHRSTWLQAVRGSGAAIALLMLLAFNLVATGSFWTLQTLNVNLTQVAPIVIVAVGMALVVGTGGIDLSVGSSAAIAGTLAAVFLSQPSGPLADPALALGCALTLPLAAAAVA